MKKHKKKNKYFSYSAEMFITKFFKFWYWLFKDIKNARKSEYKPFNEYGLTLYASKQGSGKTTGVVEYLERMRTIYPKCVIVTNFGYKHQSLPFSDWNDFFNIRSEYGVIFAIDELQNEFSSTAWKNFPETLLTEITQQRKQKVKIVATSQVFTRVAKPLREQTFEVVECHTWFGRWTFLKAFDAVEYEAVVENPAIKNKLHRLWRRNFVQDDKLRELFDSYAKIERIKRTDFLPRSERFGGVNR